ncbi:hypothetical protein [Rothia mucilaginosa]|uniref:hypothetical protein n=1 Tax=Rothia mucilaginosa TaxID=43675 RepID=UPI001C56734A|nr:hypothetical protein [Rothia mucilaginosa]QXW97702.1 hypothetical protein LPB405_04750 [Rothia mucilaginosa]
MAAHSRNTILWTDHRQMWVFYKSHIFNPHAHFSPSIFFVNLFLAPSQFKYAASSASSTHLHDANTPDFSRKLAKITPHPTRRQAFFGILFKFFTPRQ